MLHFKVLKYICVNSQAKTSVDVYVHLHMMYCWILSIILQTSSHYNYK